MQLPVTAAAGQSSSQYGTAALPLLLRSSPGDADYHQQNVPPLVLNVWRLYQEFTPEDTGFPQSHVRVFNRLLDIILFRAGAGSCATK